MKTIPITRAGHRKLKEELEHLEMVEWPAIVKEIEIAREHGDLSENAEFQYAKEKQGMIDAKVRQLKDKIARADIIDVEEMKGDTAAFSARVDVRNMDTGDEQTYYLVGPEETDVLSGKISVSSPVGRALVGKGKGEIAEVQTPGGLRRLKIVAIKW